LRIAARKKPAEKPTRRSPGDGACYQRTGTKTDPATGESVPYVFWQAVRDVPEPWLPEGKTRHRITGNGPTRADAQRRLEENWAKFLNAPTPGKRTRRRKGPSSRKEMTVAELFTEWNEANKAGRISDIVAHKYAQMWDNHIAEHLGDTRVRDVTSQMIDHLIHLKIGTKTRQVTIEDGSKKKTVKEPVMKLAALNNIRTCLSSMFAFAKTAGMIDYNPVLAVKMKTPSTQTQNLTDAMKRADELLDALRDNKDPDYCRWLFQFLGLRRAERLGLTWGCVEGLDTDQPYIVIDRQLARRPTGSVWYLKDKTKNEQIRKVALVGEFADALRAHKLAQDELKKLDTWKPKPEFADLVFLKPNGGMITLNQDNIDWHRVLEKHQMTYWPGHLNRHITATRLASIEPVIATPIIESILGHRSDALKRFYVHRREVEQFASMGRYADKFRPTQTPNND
jgi:integrase